MTAQNKTSKGRGSPGKNKDGKKVSGNMAKDKKKTAKYTLWRSPEDIKNLEKVRTYLEKNNWKKYKTDSGIYKELPDLFLDAVKTIEQLNLEVRELTAKKEDLEEISGHVCRIIEMVKK